MSVNIKCEDCKKREGIIRYSDEPMLALTHGWCIEHICRQCYIKRMEADMKRCKKGIEEQKRLLKKDEMV